MSCLWTRGDKSKNGESKAVVGEEAGVGKRKSAERQKEVSAICADPYQP